MTRRHTSAKVRVDAHVPCSAAQALALSVGDVLFGLWVTVLLGHTEIDDVDDYKGRIGLAVDWC